MSLLLLFGGAGSAEVVTDVSYILNGITIKTPHELVERKVKSYVQNRPLVGSINRDYYGSTKRVWELIYRNLNVTDFAVIKSIYNAYLSDDETLSFVIEGTNYSVSSTNVFMTLPEREFPVTGSSYVSDFVVTITET